MNRLLHATKYIKTRQAIVIVLEHRSCRISQIGWLDRTLNSNWRRARGTRLGPLAWQCSPGLYSCPQGLLTQGRSISAAPKVHAKSRYNPSGYNCGEAKQDAVRMRECGYGNEDCKEAVRWMMGKKENKWQIQMSTRGCKKKKGAVRRIVLVERQ